MSSFSCIVRFESEEDGTSYFADLGNNFNDVPTPGTSLTAFKSYDDFEKRIGEKDVTVRRLLAPLPHYGVPMYCVGLNYRSHAKETLAEFPQYPPLWTKPAASLAHPDEDIPVNEFCAKSMLDYEGELVFITSKECRDISPSEAKNFILGYTLGNDLSCRLFQLPNTAAGQFFYAKAFDKFGPLGPVLLSPTFYESVKSKGIVVKVNGDVRQRTDPESDMIFSPEQILSHMSQGTTIPAGTAVMTGTPMGVGFFRNPKVFLEDGDVIEVGIPNVAVLRNKIKFE